MVQIMIMVSDKSLCTHIATCHLSDKATNTIKLHAGVNN